MGSDSFDKNLNLVLMTVLGICLCTLVCLNKGGGGGEIIIKVPAWIRCVIYIAIGLVSLAVCILFFYFGVSSICHSVNCCKTIKISEKEYFVLTKENINERCVLKKQKNILVYDNIHYIFPHQFSGFCNLEKIEFYGEVQIHEAAFFGCTNLNEVVFHNDIISIGKNTFAGCKKLKTIKYDGERDKWNESAEKWNSNLKKDVPAKGVICVDGNKYWWASDGNTLSLNHSTSK